MENCIRLKPLVKAVDVKSSSVFVPPTGYINELAKLCGCTRQHVRNSLRKNLRGEKADLVRRMFRAKYVQQAQQDSVLCE